MNAMRSAPIAPSQIRLVDLCRRLEEFTVRPPARASLESLDAARELVRCLWADVSKADRAGRVA